jgi:FkbM family methyltransferase
MTLIQSHEDLLKEIDSNFAALQRLAKGQTTPTAKGWLIHFNHLWAELLKQAGWPAIPTRRQALLHRLFPMLRRRNVEVFPSWTSPIWNHPGLYFPFPPKVTDYPTAYGFQFSSNGLDFWQILATSHYSTELYETLLMLRLLPEIDYFVDIGANIGFYSLLMATQSKGRVSVSSCEPNEANFTTLSHNIAINHQETIIRAFREAVGSEPGVADLYLCMTGSGGHSLEPVSDRMQDRRREQVSVVTLDDIRNSAADKARTLIKIDVEGAEQAVLRGGRDWLTSEHAPILLFEAWSNSQTHPRRNHQVVVQHLRDSGYLVFSIGDFKEGATPVRAITSRAFRPAPNGNYLALPKWALPLDAVIEKPVGRRIFTDTHRLHALASFITRSTDAMKQYGIFENADQKGLSR